MKNKFLLLILFTCLMSLTSNSQVFNGSSSPVNTNAIGRAPINPPNVLTFDYDIAGNQILRRFIYVSSGVYKTVTKSETKPQLLDSDIYDDIKYYPNPVLSELFIKWRNSETNFVNHLQLYSETGQLIKSYETLKNSEEATIDFQPFPSGTYILLLRYENGEQKDLKIIKR